jgi:hypothetical protein
MRKPALHRFHLIDAMLLAAAISLGLSMARYVDAYYWIRTNGGREDGTVGHKLPGILNSFEYLLIWSVPCAMTGTLGLLLLRVRRWRLPLPHLVREPGIAACGTVAIVMLIGLVRRTAWFVLETLTTSSSPVRLPHPPFVEYLDPMRDSPMPLPAFEAYTIPFASLPASGTSIVALWMFLAFSSGSAVRSPGWLDRAGVVFGVCWIGLALCFELMNLCGRYLD